MEYPELVKFTADTNTYNGTRLKRKPRILLGVTGSVAAVKIPELAVKLTQQLKVDLRVILTHGAQYFWHHAVARYDPFHWNEMHRIIAHPHKERMRRQRHEEIMMEEYSGNDEAKTMMMRNRMEMERGDIYMHEAEDEWKDWNCLGDPVLHIFLRDWADVAVVAPLSAHTLAKISNGLCDDPLTNCLRAWDYGHGHRKGKPIIYAPAMNTAMWIHPLTGKQLDTIRSFWCSIHENKDENEESEQKTEKGDHEKKIDEENTHENAIITRDQMVESQYTHDNGVWVIEPQKKTLACGEVGYGAMADVDDILRMVQICLDIFVQI